MKQFLLVTILTLCFSGLKLIGQEAVNTNASTVWIEQAGKQNKKYIRYFDADRKASKENWMTQTAAIDIQKGIYRIRFTNAGTLVADKVMIRKVEQNSGNSTESRILLPASYFRVEHPSQDIVDIYFSAGANRFFADMPGYLLITGLLQKNNQSLADMTVGVNHYLALTEKKKVKPFTLLAVR